MTVGTINNTEKAVETASQIYTLRAEIKKLQEQESELKDALFMLSGEVEGVYKFTTQARTSTKWEEVVRALSIDYGIKPYIIDAVKERYTTVADIVILKFAKNYCV